VTDQKLGVELALVVAVRCEALAKAWAEVPDVVWAKAWAAELATGVVGKRHKKLIQIL
jgi:hypothetical protein